MREGLLLAGLLLVVGNTFLLELEGQGLLWLWLFLCVSLGEGVFWKSLLLCAFRSAILDDLLERIVEFALADVVLVLM